MFTGIVQGTALIVDIESRPGLTTLSIEFPAEAVNAVERGASVSIDGTCLTVTGQTGSCLTFDVMQETLRITKAGHYKIGDRVNFERAARIGDEIGGHLLSGHVHTQAKLADIRTSENNRTFYFQVAPEWLRYIFPKGFIAIDGASLTVGDVDDEGFNVHLIPETLRATCLGDLSVGETINLEIDSQTQVIVETLDRLGYKPAG
ncbi:riboflavin synthase subunit alpha [Mangrovitalea sediminis]|uniref:riboflavin synthase subunit alpha n=1 Tax=Mangrovitalea sediminis TaxID=1982043 RepID=UPI000BE605E6|nr:riboflavin synthase subunit alpha [Mangrovitalea sediminis]